MAAVRDKVCKMNNGFYRAFEDKYRGSRELILGRLNAYAPLLKTLKSTFPGAQTLDLGCGRGEWLELLGSLGISASGVDLDEGMLAACRERGYKVEHQDAISYLAALPAESFALISAFHLVEHISFEALSTLISEAFRVLKPGGILIMETPNPENLSVGTESFYLDPSHVKPIPPKLLSFLPEYIGFNRTTVFRLQEPMSLAYQEAITLLDVLTGVSPDYAVVAQKGADPEILAAFDSSFSVSLGLTLEKLSRGFEERLQKYESRFMRIEAEYNQKIDELANELLSVYNSTSWRITRPMRQTIDFLRSRGLSKQCLNPKYWLRGLLAILDRASWIKSFLGLLLRPFPGLRIRLMQAKSRAQRGGAWSVAPRKKAIVYNMAVLSAGKDAPVDEIIERINLELGARK